MSIHKKTTLALVIAMGAMSGCTAQKVTYTVEAITPVIRDAAIEMHEAPEAEQPAVYIPPSEIAQYEQAYAEPAPVSEPIVPSSSDDLYERAKMIMQGSSDPEMQKIAIGLLSQASESGHAESTRVLGLLALKDGPERQAEGLEMLERASQSSVKAKRQLGLLYANMSQPHLDNTDKAIELLQDASAMGDGESSLYLSKIMAKLGLTDDAQRWKEVAHEQGVEQVVNQPLQHEATKPDDVLKAYSLQRGALAGDPESMYGYALMLLNNQAQGSLMGYEHSAEFEAYYWLRKASALGDVKADQKLQEVAYIEALMSASRMTYEKLNRALGSQG